MKVGSISSKVWVGALGAATVLLFQTRATAQGNGHQGWVQEPPPRSLNVEDSGHAYLDSESVHPGEDGLIYFNESSSASGPGETGKAGVMKDAYDCKKNIKYVCVELGNWRDDPKSRISAVDDPALPVYRKYLCGDAQAAKGSLNPSNDLQALGRDKRK
jgi:hypothetical protein